MGRSQGHIHIIHVPSSMNQPLQGNSPRGELHAQVECKRATMELDTAKEEKEQIEAQAGRAELNHWTIDSPHQQSITSW